MTAWLLHAGGIDDVSGRWYAFWSGFGGDLALVAAVATVPYALWRRHNCHQPRCWRIGRYHIAGGAFTVCGRHFPGGRPQAHHILAAHQAHIRRQNPPADSTAGGSLGPSATN